jgi:LmbE family N-acetylglucosaminyl deacetylase
VDTTTTAKLVAMLREFRPSVVVAPWPLDVHADHQACGLLAWRAFMDRRLDFELYFYETSNWPHTVSFDFVPTDYIDITAVMDRKRQALYEQKSQGPADWWDMYVSMARFRGYESDTPYAEAYLRARNSQGMGGRPGSTGKTLPGRR